MSSSQRSIIRLPLHVFTDLISHRDDNPYTSSELRSAVCRKLVDAGRSQSIASASDGITTVGSIMRLTSPALLRAVDPLLTNDECDTLIKRICQVCSPKPVTAKVLLRECENQYICSDVPALDHCLSGGFRIGSVSEIVGRAGVGKTQLAMQLCVVAARMGFGSVYIDTERKLCLPRLHEIAKERYKTTPDSTPVDSSTNLFYENDSQPLPGNDVCQTNPHQRESHNKKYLHPNDVMNNVIVHSPASTDELLSIMSNLDEDIILRNESSTSDAHNASSDTTSISPQYPVKLIILDSIAAPTRRDFGGGNAPQRVEAIFKIAQILKRIANQLQVAIVVINQIDKIQGLSNNQSHDSDFVSVTAALGTSWHHCVTTRVALEHKRDPHRDDAMLAMQVDHVRVATIVKSNLVGLSTMSFEVNQTGIFQVD